MTMKNNLKFLFGSDESQDAVSRFSIYLHHINRGLAFIFPFRGSDANLLKLAVQNIFSMQFRVHPGLDCFLRIDEINRQIFSDKRISARLLLDPIPKFLALGAGMVKVVFFCHILGFFLGSALKIKVVLERREIVFNSCFVGEIGEGFLRH